MEKSQEKGSKACVCSLGEQVRMKLIVMPHHQCTVNDFL